MNINRVTLLGNVGKTPEVRTMQNCNNVAKLTLATSTSWKDKETGERESKTTWHNIVIYQQGMIPIIQEYVRKGSKLYIEGELQINKWNDKEGHTRSNAEVVLNSADHKVIILDKPTYKPYTEGEDQ